MREGATTYLVDQLLQPRVQVRLALLGNVANTDTRARADDALGLVLGHGGREDGRRRARNQIDLGAVEEKEERGHGRDLVLFAHLRNRLGFHLRRGGEGAAESVSMQLGGPRCEQRKHAGRWAGREKEKKLRRVATDRRRARRVPAPRTLMKAMFGWSLASCSTTTSICLHGAHQSAQK